MNPEEIKKIAQTERETQAKTEPHLHVCMGTACLSSGADKVQKALATEIKAQGKEQCCKIRGVGCLGLCAEGPLVSVEPKGWLYRDVKPQDAKEIVETLPSGPVKRMQLDTSLPFFTRQKLIVRENAGRIDPERIEDSIAAGGYMAFIRALTEMTPHQVIQEIVQSGLRGRGGAGFPTGLKWTTVSKAHGDKKYVICNSDEGDPGAFMDRSVVESDPHRVLEGMAIAGYATGASEGYVYIRAEYPLAIKRLKKAIQQAERMGILGSGCCGTTFNFYVQIRLGAGAFVCGEETALIASIEGKRGAPRPRPPYPAQYGLWGKPTLINNVESLANVPPIISRGAQWYSSIGTEKSKGTKIFALTGKVRNTGLIEVPMGITLREIVYDIGGGFPEGRKFKAVQTGGPSGGCIPEELLDLPVDYESLISAGSMMGSGGMIIMDDTSNMVDVARYFMEFCMTESCGKCIPCRVGTAQMHDLLQKFCAGKAGGADLKLLEELCDVVKHTSLCGLGQTAPNPVLSTLRYFRKEYESCVKGGGAAGGNGSGAASPRAEA